MRKIFLALVFALLISACGGGSDSADSERLEELQEQIESLQEEITQTTTTVEKTTTTKTTPSTPATNTTTTVISEPSPTTSTIPSTTSATIEETSSLANEDYFQEINIRITSLPETLDFLSPHFSKHLDIWGTKIIATPRTPDEKVIHAANILAEYLDNDEDGIPDDDSVISALVKNKSMITMAATELDFEETLDKIDGFEIFDKGFTVQDLYGDETAPEYAFDASLEEVHHLILNYGWGEVYPDQLRQEAGSAIADAMDIARGGRFDSTPSQYPDGAWFTYDDWTCEYECMVTEYTYWAHTSLLGGQADRFDEIGHEWRANTPELMRSIDDYATSILQDPRLKLPKSLPDGNYRGMGLSTVDELATTVPTATTAPPETTAPPTTTTEVINNSVSNDFKIDLINFSSTPDSDLMNWANFASDKMSERTSNILVVAYNIGEYIGEEIPGMPFNSNEVILSQSEIDLIMAQTEQWLLNDPCMSEQRGHRNEELESYRFWLENGADTSTHRGLCEETRLVMMAWKDGIETWNLQRFLVHELYHAFQRDIANEYCNDTIERMGRGEHAHAVVEGAADYFTFFTADEMYTDADRQNYDRIGYRGPLNNLFREASNLINEDRSNDVTGSGIATRAAIMVRLMVEKGWISHEGILDGSFHHNCERADLNPSNPDFVFAWENWFQFENQNEEWRFSDSILSN
tara:strand:- start:41 stop:2122 length:2082 start_codon:yes stop_codon:yes gene_type:complete